MPERHFPAFPAAPKCRFGTSAPGTTVPCGWPNGLVTSSQSHRALAEIGTTLALLAPVKAQKRPEGSAPASLPVPKRVVFVGEAPDWQAELGAVLAREGYATERVPQLEGVLPLLESGALQALLVAARPLAASDLLILRRVREAAPHTAIVVVTKTPTNPDLKRAFESGATAFLSWPASTDALRHAIERRDPGASTRPRVRPGTA